MQSQQFVSDLSKSEFMRSDKAHTSHAELAADNGEEIHLHEFLVNTWGNSHLTYSQREKDEQSPMPPASPLCSGGIPFL
jgi:hypothetical protein